MKRDKIITCLLIAIALFSALGCSEKDKYRIGVSQCSSDDWRNKMNDEIRREIMLHPDVEVEIRSADDSNEKQIADIRYFMDNDFDIIIAAPNEADAVTPIIKEVFESGKPIMVFDRSINGNTYTASQNADNFGIGRSAALYAHSLVGSGAKIIEIKGLKGSTPAKGRSDGFHSLCDSLNFNIVESVYGNWNYEDAHHVIDSLLNIYKDIDLIYAHNDRMAIAAGESAEAHGMKIKIIGIDAAPEIGIKAVADGKIDATFFYPTEGYRLIRTALAILKGEPYERDVILPVASAVDKSNADILLLQNESLKEETAKIETLKSQVDDYWTQHSAQTALFYAVIAILALLFGVLFVILRSYWVHKRHQAQLLEQNKILERQRDTEKSLNQQLNEATQSKLMFYTNVSHDLRTPLTLIAEPVEQLAEADYLTPQHRALIKVANKNVRILRRLINQILDFRKYENGKLNLNLTETNPEDLILEWSEGFKSIAAKRDIKLCIDIDLPAGFSMALDVEKIERVFFNLLSNAFKFTPDNGRITVNCAADNESLILRVSDTGQGIPEEEIAKIFDRFYQVDKIHPTGSGIGLSLAKAFVNLHEGEITVNSEVGKGCEFTLTLPIRHVADAAAPAEVKRLIPDNEISTELEEVKADPISTDSALPLLLIIDDNDDIRLMIRELLCDEYNIIEAVNGKEGVRLASKYTPDLIICDVMMPVMDGMECCKRIKNEVSTSHIPVLMLTACSMEEQRIEGYESGADGYLAKPFNSRMLQMRCRNLIDNRKRIREIFKSAAVPASEKKSEKPIHSGSDIDNEFYNRFLAIVNTEIGNPELSIDSIAEKLGLGRSQFYRKIKALTNYSPVELLRKIRLEKSKELLTATEKTISEIAYEVGFSAPAYFTRVYRENYGETPSDLRERLGHK